MNRVLIECDIQFTWTEVSRLRQPEAWYFLALIADKYINS